MALVQRLFYTLVSMIVLASSLKLLMKANSSPLPSTDDADLADPDSGNYSAANSSSGVNCRNNSTGVHSRCNVTKFLTKWLSPSKDEAGISKLTMASNFLIRLTGNKEVRKLTATYYVIVHVHAS